MHADKGSFWVFDEAPFELWSYSGKFDNRILRVAANQGIVGQCFTQGSAMIVHDAYKVRNFSAKMDKRTGYTTKTLMCIPVHGEDQLFDSNELRTNLGCLQLLNKNGLEGTFDTRDATIVQLQLIVLRSYLRSFRDTESINSNLPRLEHALQILSKSTEDEDEAALKAQFAGLAREFVTSNIGWHLILATIEWKMLKTFQKRWLNIYHKLELYMHRRLSFKIQGICILFFI